MKNGGNEKKTPALPGKRWVTPADGLIFVLILALALLLPLADPALRSGGPGRYASVTAGKQEYTLDLETDQTLAVSEHLTVSVSNGAVFVSFSDCKGQDCVRAGSISAPGETLVCAPNRTVIRILGGNGEVDARAE